MNCFYLFQGKKDDDFLFRKLKENISIPALSPSCQSCLTFVLCAPLQILIQEPLPHWDGYSPLDIKETYTRKLAFPHHICLRTIWRIHTEEPWEQRFLFFLSQSFCNNIGLCKINPSAEIQITCVHVLCQHTVWGGFQRTEAAALGLEAVCCAPNTNSALSCSQSQVVIVTIPMFCKR